ncbi:hypothetical protein JAAARDRAFT_30056 [Jaapia argillacea MUCL 33604]|uniref:Uncharacterized protein n=1 Tax=Jaapia argillacea MUCL 33604 TaxID=933084 RepID=A0A067Q522_9AGAM|nr:hypothetical protein JAAARDRAFT_30056 [Jaapia argillacea MUCL 33604]
MAIPLVPSIPEQQAAGPTREHQPSQSNNELLTEGRLNFEGVDSGLEMFHAINVPSYGHARATPFQRGENEERLPRTNYLVQVDVHELNPEDQPPRHGPRQSRKRKSAEQANVTSSKARQDKGRPGKLRDIVEGTSRDSTKIDNVRQSSQLCRKVGVVPSN